MIKYLLIFALLLAPTSLIAEQFGENPAFCLGFLSTLSEVDKQRTLKVEKRMRIAFAANGPKDSTDERTFEEWQQIGHDAAFDKTYPNFGALKSRCQQIVLRQK